VCIQLLAARIQNADSDVPAATSNAALTCSQRGTRCQPNSRMPRKVASRKNGEHLVADQRAHHVADGLREALQLVPNW